jgi:hypothetical protein
MSARMVSYDQSAIVAANYSAAGSHDGFRYKFLKQNQKSLLLTLEIHAGVFMGITGSHLVLPSYTQSVSMAGGDAQTSGSRCVL